MESNISNNTGEWLKKKINEFAESPVNTMKKWDSEPVCGVPIVGFSSGADPLYEFYKKDIGDPFISPIEFIKSKYSDKSFEAGNITVISWILPHTEATKRDHQKETHFPSERWVRARLFGEEFNVKLREHIVELLQNEGIKSVAPTLSPLYTVKSSSNYGFAASWSERHAAYAAGLGTFGLSDGLITKAGKAMRAGSVIANIKIDPNERNYYDHHAYCLYYMSGACGKCIERCPIGAITEKGHDKNLCAKYAVGMTRKYNQRHYELDIYGCGFCQTSIPCESEIPRELNPTSNG